MYCSKCGESVSENQETCPSCGVSDHEIPSKDISINPSLQTSLIPGVHAIWIILVAYFLSPLITIANSDFRSWGWLVPLAILILEKKSSLVKYNAAQSLLIHLTRLAIMMIVLRLPGYSVGFMMLKSFMVQFSFAILYILSLNASSKAYTGQLYKLPVIGGIVDKLFGSYIATED